MINRKSATCAVSEVSAASGSKERTERINRNERLEAAMIEVAEIVAGISKKFLPCPSKRPQKRSFESSSEGKNRKSGNATFSMRC